MFKQLFKYLFVISLSVLIFFAVLFASGWIYYYQNTFKPEQKNIMAFIHEAPNEEQNLSTPARQLLLNVINKRSCLMAARALNYNLDISHPIDGIHGEQLTEFYWSLFLCQELTEQQRLTIVAAQWPHLSSQNSYGLNAVSRYLYSLPLSELSIEQLANVVACNRGEFVCLHASRRKAIAEGLLDDYYQNN